MTGLNRAGFYRSRTLREATPVEMEIRDETQKIAVESPTSGYRRIASLTTNDEWKVAFSPGGGVKFRLIPHMVLRGEPGTTSLRFRGSRCPASHNTARGVFHQFTPLFGVSYTF
jgi:hypothetical protein